MQVVKEILAALNTSFEEMAINESYTIESGSSTVMDLTIEKVATSQLSVAHYYTHNGDLVADPEVTFRVESEPDNLTPIELRQNPGIRHYNESGIDDEQFFERWSNNIRAQGFVDAAANHEVTTKNGGQTDG